MDKKFTVRQRIGLKLIFLAIAIVQPTQYSHEITKPLEDIEKMIKEEAS